MSVGQNVYLWRVEKKLTQNELARRSGVPQSYISSIEKGKDLKISTLEKLAEALEVDARDLLGGIKPIQIDKSKLFQRKVLEKIINSYVRNVPLKGDRYADFVGLLEMLDPREKKYLSKKELQLSWMKLRNTMSRGEIETVLSRLRKARQRVGR